MDRIAKERFGMTAYYPRWQKHTIEQMMLERQVLLLGEPRRFRSAGPMRSGDGREGGQEPSRKNAGAPLRPAPALRFHTTGYSLTTDQVPLHPKDSLQEPLAICPSISPVIVAVTPSLAAKPADMSPLASTLPVIS